MKRAFLAATCFVIAACGGSTPTTPQAVVTAPVITTTNTMVYIGQSVTFTATGSGTIRWGGDQSSVATVDQTTGRVTGVDNGRVTIWAENEGGRTTRLLRVLPSFAGNWVGNWIVDGCQQNGVFQSTNACSGARNGTSRSMNLGFAQTDDRIAGNGAIAFGSLTGSTTSATVGDDGVFRTTASMDPLSGNTIRISVDNMSVRSPAAGNMQGNLEQVWGDLIQSGTMRIFAHYNLTRSSGGPSILFARPGADGTGLTVHDITRMMGQ